MFTRLLIGETISDAQLKEIRRHFSDACINALRFRNDLVSWDLLSESGGDMIVLVTKFKTRAAAIDYHSSREHRLLVVRTQHLLIGDYIVKMFDNVD